MRTLFTIILLASSIAGFCRQPVEFSLIAQKTGENKYDLIVKGKLSGGWYIYDEMDVSTGLAPMRITCFHKDVTLPPYKPAYKPLIINDPIFDNQQLQVFRGDFGVTQPILIEGETPASLSIVINGFAANGMEFIPFSITKTVELEGGVSSQPLKLSTIHLDKPLADCGDKRNTGQGLPALFLLGFAGGLVALLTPCIFPMIPVTVSFFINRARTRGEGISNAALYGGLIFGIYVLASVPFHVIGNIDPQIFNIIATNAWINLFFFVVFVLFALSFFGLFDIRMPSRIANATGSRGGIFFMALTLAIVSFSCTGVILGSLLVNAISSGSNAWQLTAGMAGFGMALALPFGFFAMFPQWLKKLPRSGGWLETVKKSLAFVELAIAIKFLSNADLVEHWGILKREIFIASWVVIALFMGLYLLGVFDRKRKVTGLYVATNNSRRRVPYARLIMGVLVLAFALYLLQGVTRTYNAKLAFLSGFPPPLSYSIYGKDNDHGKGLKPDVINDYEKALRMAKQRKKPLLIDFTGWACVNCRKMEELVWTKPGVQNIIRENYVLLSLYVDDRKKTDDGGTIGEKWAKFQSENFGQVTQPLYVLLSPGEELLNRPVGYTPDEKKYRKWLQCGLNSYEHGKAN